MAERPVPWPAADPPPPGWTPADPRPPMPVRPVYREPHPITTAPLLAGMGATLLWFALFGAVARDLAGYAWWTLLAALSAWVVALVLAKAGDRGVAVGVALVGGIGLSVAMGFVTFRWVTTNDWPLW